MKYHRRYKRHRSGCCGKPSFSGFKEKVSDITAGKGFYRSRQGMLLGVCRGIAEHFNVSVRWTRIIVFFTFLFTGFWPVGVMYILAGLLLKPAPVIPLENETEQEFYDSYASSRSSAIQRIKRKFENIDRRIQRMEHTVTSREFEL